jgi:hypothetical protein
MKLHEQFIIPYKNSADCYEIYYIIIQMPI